MLMTKITLQIEIKRNVLNVIKVTFLKLYQKISCWWKVNIFIFSSVQFSCSVAHNSLQPPGQQHARFPCPSPTPRTCSNSCALNWWCHPTISSSIVPFSSCLQSFPASGSFLMSQFCTSDGQSIGASASVLPISIRTDFLQNWLVWSPCSPRDSHFRELRYNKDAHYDHS